MKEIKFRAFYNGKMIYQSKENIFVFPLGATMFGIKLGSLESKIMQFTGLKDKNGKEIYEGDIVKVYWGNSFEKAGEVEAIADVKWNEDGYYTWNDHCYLKNAFTYFTRGDESNAEVIGNIYENPELLK